jgi:hypothetical protein
VEIDSDDATDPEMKPQPSTPALKAELTWAKLYTKTMHEDLVAISTAIGKTRPTTSEAAMQKSAEHLHDQLQSANRTVGELSDYAGVRPMPAKRGHGNKHKQPKQI